MMPPAMLLLPLHLVLCAAIFWACLCRLQLTTGDTAREVRWSISLTLTGAVAAGIAPLVWGAGVSAGQVLLECGFALQLVAFRRIWRAGAPDGVGR